MRLFFIALTVLVTTVAGTHSAKAENLEDALKKIVPRPDWAKLNNVYFNMEDLDIGVERHSTRLGDPPMIQITVNGKKKEVTQKQYDQLVAQRRLRILKRMLKSNKPPQKPAWLEGPIHSIVKLYETVPGPKAKTTQKWHATNYGILSDEQVNELKDYVARLEIQRAIQRAAKGLTAEDVASQYEAATELDVREELLVYRGPSLRGGWYDTSQGRMTKDGLDQFGAKRQQYLLHQVIDALQVKDKPVPVSNLEPRRPPFAPWWRGDRIPIVPGPILPDPIFPNPRFPWPEPIYPDLPDPHFPIPMPSPWGAPHYGLVPANAITGANYERMQDTQDVTKEKPAVADSDGMNGEVSR
jgi:hypothetical protein